MHKSESIKDLATALSKFQKDVQDPEKNSDNPFFKSKYVELNDLLISVRPKLTENGLSILQEPSNTEAGIAIKTVLLHTSGEFIEFEALVMKPVKNDPQGMGSAITYGRRYALSAILGVAWSDDDDGNEASGKQMVKAESKKKNEAPSPKPAPASQDAPVDEKKQLLIKLSHHAKEVGLSPEDIKQLMQHKYKAAASSDLTIAQVKDLIKNASKYWSEFIKMQEAS